MRRALRAVVLVTASALVDAGCPEPPGPPEPPPPNQAPVARVVVPQLWPAGEPMAIDGSLSADPDDEPLAYRATWGDGTPAVNSVEPLFAHTFDAAGSFAVELAVKDGAGAEALVQVQVVIIDAGEPAACTCEVGCADDGICTTRGCLLFRSSAGVEELPSGALGETISCPG